MRGKLAKAIRRATRFHPADERQYRLENVARKVVLKYGIPVPVQTGTFVSVGERAEYQGLKQYARRVKRQAGVRHAA